MSAWQHLAAVSSSSGQRPVNLSRVAAQLLLGNLRSPIEFALASRFHSMKNSVAANPVIPPAANGEVCAEDILDDCSVHYIGKNKNRSTTPPHKNNPPSPPPPPKE